MRNRYTTISSLLSLILIFSSSVFSQSSIFTYQGKLSDTGSPPTGTYQMEFRLFDAISGGTQIGSLITNNAVSVTEGIFTVNLNFGGVTAFPGADRFLEISVRRNAGESFVTLGPRQQIASSPYSIRTLSAARADNSTQLAGVPASQYLQTNGSGAGLTNLNASSITAGTLGNARLGQIPTANIADSAVTAAKIASAQVVKSINTLKDDVMITAGSNVTITPAGNTLTIASAGTCASPCTAAIFNATQQYNFGGNRVLAAPGSNTYLGVTAGTNNIGILNSFFGAGSGEANTMGNGNSFFGGGSGQDSVDGSDNSFFGGNTGRGNTSGSRNSFFGRLAGRFNTFGNDNTFVGYNAGNSTGGGSLNTYVGAEAGEANTGSQNAFFGQSAGKAVGTGSQNSFFGEAAGIANTSGGGNSFFGRRSGDANTQGNSNSFFGVFSGDGNSTGDNNVFVGTGAGTSNTVGDRNTVIGANANVGSNDLINATAIGANATVSQSNSVVLGNNANVGIGTSFPSEKLHVSGVVLSSGSLGGTFIARNPTDSARAVQFGWLDDIATVLVERPSGGFNNAFRIRTRSGNGFSTKLFVDDNVGIGTDSPTNKLHVAGSVRVGLGVGGDTHLCHEGGVISQCGSSLLRYKTDVAGFTPGLDLLNRLRPVSFRWRNSGRSDIGLVAEEVAEVEPLLATHNEKGEIEGVKYDRVGVVLINAVKEQQSQIEELAKQNQSLLKQIEQQRKQIENLVRIVCSGNSMSENCRQ